MADENSPTPLIGSIGKEATEPTSQLFREALDETRHLVRLEVLLARKELQSDLALAKKGGIVLALAAILAVSAIALLLCAVALAFATPWLAAVVLGGILLCVAAPLGFAGWKTLPKKPLGQTKERLEDDLKQLKERIA
jgi:hypothetical protein